MASSAAPAPPSAAPSVKHWEIRNLQVENVLTNGAVVPWPKVATTNLAVNVLRVSRAIRRLREGGLDTGGPKFTGGGSDFSGRYATVLRDLVVVYDRPLSSASRTRLSVFGRPGSSRSEGEAHGQAIIEAIRADIQGSRPDLTGLTGTLST